MDEVDFTVLAATSVFTDLMEKCPPAEACRDAFDRTVKATIKMANSTGGFGQKPRPHHRLDWSRGATVDTSSQISGSSKHKHAHRGSIEQLAADLSSVSDAYSNSASPSSLPPFQKQQQYHRLKAEPSETSSGGFSMMRNLPAPPRSTASGGSADIPGATPEAIDPSLVGSPVGGQTSSPIIGMARPAFAQQQQGDVFGSGAMGGGGGFGDLRGIDFLQGLDGGAGGGGLDDTTGDFNFGEQMDLGFGLGWEGLHHDFSEGQQVDLFDGFFFGGQQGNGAGGAGMGGL
jgi:hypothetical protein